MNDLIVDPNIRTWVFLPIVLITFLVGVILHYVTYLVTNQDATSLEQLQDSQIVIRSRLMRANANYIPSSSFYLRRYHFLDKDEAFLAQRKKKGIEANILTDPNVLIDMVKHNFLNVLPMMAVGGWITVMFSGFITTKIPFRLTLSFKSMLQREIDLSSLDAAWVSSASWYVLNLCGLRNIYSLILEEVATISDPIKEVHDYFVETASSMSNDIADIFKEENEALAIKEHNWVMQDIANQTIKAVCN